jgi:Fur family transcriptional regulator, ferric uptake regulator
MQAEPIRGTDSMSSSPLNQDCSLQRLCIRAGLKLTGAHRVLIRVLTHSNDHLSVEELHRRALGFDPRISIGTVYRTVRQFEEKGILNRRDFASIGLRAMKQTTTAHITT